MTVEEIVEQLEILPAELKDSIISLLVTQQTELANMTAERNMWKNNHDQAVHRAALLRQRPDLPVDRIPAYEELAKLQGDLLDAFVINTGDIDDMTMFAGTKAAAKLFPNIPACRKLVFKVDSTQLVTESFFFGILDKANFKEVLLDTQKCNEQTISEFERAVRRLQRGKSK